ncbi:hypothetical protein Sa4125_22990 [Aureimonas sp. SA4125]|uniref:hypothetical protein n=1 Tax=Aureimonas sp. SA4125 TaxID=2826993 RepID=UPI001CC644FD|nr:hypothetical protein [Aureimonas sp. SA4125]BDA84757.1 hypothetical protein Sa4125_22990 [Aureimonas sp. SA4125]
MNRVIALAIPLALLASSALAKDVAFKLSNATSSAVTEFYLSLPGDDEWGENLVVEAIPAGGSAPAQITDTDTCIFDVKTVFADGTDTEDREYDLCANSNYKIEEE